MQYNLYTPDIVYSGFLSNPAKNSGPNNFPVYLNVIKTPICNTFLFIHTLFPPLGDFNMFMYKAIMNHMHMYVKSSMSIDNIN